jgi:hypothetical protein
LRGVPEDVVGEIGEGEKGGCDQSDATIMPDSIDYVPGNDYLLFLHLQYRLGEGFADLADDFC